MAPTWQVWPTISPRVTSARPLDVDGKDNAGIDLMQKLKSTTDLGQQALITGHHHLAKVIDHFGGSGNHRKRSVPAVRPTLPIQTKRK
ncbi:hypothetical protein CRG98_046217 [Punica granatum]|uniref:Uncharacterized protein n=1 Tax=Punica granatum TaxID=22663 RepID=A0A2I0HNT3_PUNGR|nr:hypothetical protein CRG98_046217 [Punica granatum]